MVIREQTIKSVRWIRTISVNHIYCTLPYQPVKTFQDSYLPSSGFKIVSKNRRLVASISLPALHSLPWFHTEQFFTAFTFDSELFLCYALFLNKHEQHYSIEQIFSVYVYFISNQLYNVYFNFVQCPFCDYSWTKSWSTECLVASPWYRLSYSINHATPFQWTRW